MKLTKTNSFNQKKFNTDFENNDLNINKSNKLNKSFEGDIEKIILLPHQQSIENIIINIRDLIFVLFDMLENKKNPIPFLLSSDTRIFTFSLFLIIFGTLILLLSSLMMSPSNY